MSDEPNRSGVVVVGSINMDLVVRAPHVPHPGETVLGRNFATIPGGKGANQAIAVARLGEPCTLIGRVGDDDFGERLLMHLRINRVDIKRVVVTEGVATGVALIVVDESGENAICVASGANYKLTPHDLDAAEDAFRTARVCLLQLEVPVPTVLHAIQLCRRHATETILDPAPAMANPPRGLFDADIVSPNAGEAELLTGETLAAHAKEAKAVAAAFAQRGARQVVLKLGSHGALVFDGARFEQINGHRIQPVDTTAAGDAFTGALAVGRARGQTLFEAARLANAAGAAACSKFGAQPSMPGAADVERFLKP
jgi:ribokinase